MEKGEGRNQVPDLNKQIIDATPLSTIPPTFVVEPLRMLLPAAHEPNANDGFPSEMVRAFTSIIASNNYSPAVAVATDVGPSHAPVKRGRGRPRGSKNFTKKKLKSKNTERLIPSLPYVLGDISQRDQETGNSDLVCRLMMRFDAVRRRLRQADIIRCEITAAFATFKKLQLQTNTKKRVGSVPGVNIGDIFYLWGEMGLVGLHSAPIGAEFLEVKDSGLDKLVAVSVVSSGKNADEAEDPNVLTFTGFGGTDKFRGHASDQSLDHMNLSLVTAMKLKSVVRVVRSKKDKTRTSGKIYIYDGLYMIVNMWEEIGANGFKVFKFKLTREADQKPAFELWKSVEQWRYGLITRPGLVLQDLSNGAENLKVCVVNEVDNEQGPALFTYVTSLKQPVIKLRRSLVECCTCQTKSCCARNENCVCVSRNLDRLPYVEGVLVTRGMIVYECGGSCSCPIDCKNKMIHTGLKFSFEVFKTVDCGWGLRSWDPIRAGSFICEFAGDIIQNGDDEEDAYIFDTSRVYKPFTWNYEPELVGEDAAERVSETLDCSSRFVISAKKSGNVARFMNHSCSPNVFWQMIAREEDGLWCMYIAFFAMKHIPPLTELRYDYGASRGDVMKKKCLCRSEKCTGSFG